MSETLRKHEQVKVVVGEGMPVHRDPFTKRNLIITFDVVYPSEDWFLDVKNLKKLETCLPPKEQQIEVTDNMEEFFLVEFDETKHHSKQSKSRAAYADDDDEQVNTVVARQVSIFFSKTPSLHRICTLYQFFQK